jgi:hypothetical protein
MTGLLLAVALSAPAALSAQDTSTQSPKIKRHPDVISLQEVDALPPDVRDAYEIVIRLRPAWFKTRGPGSMTQGNVDVVTYVNEVRRGGPTALKEVIRLQVAEIRHLRGTDASFRFGVNHENGAVLVKLK